MKVIYWKARGTGNLETRQNIKNLCDQQKPNMLLIDKPMIPYAHFLTACLKQIRLKRFALNFRHNRDLNLWAYVH